MTIEVTNWSTAKTPEEFRTDLLERLGHSIELAGQRIENLKKMGSAKRDIMVRMEHLRTLNIEYTFLKSVKFK